MAGTVQPGDYAMIEFALAPPAGDIGLRRKVDRFPFVPDDVERLALDCYEAYNIQVSGLEQRLHAIGQPKVIIGVSGGLDSTHALIVAAKAMDRLGRPRSDIHAFTMPGYATGATTKSYATRLAKSLGVTFEELDITATAHQMLVNNESDSSSSSTSFCDLSTRSLSVVTFMPAVGVRQHDGASTRSPLISTMHARQLPSARMPSL